MDSSRWSKLTRGLVLVFESPGANREQLLLSPGIDSSKRLYYWRHFEQQCMSWNFCLHLGWRGLVMSSVASHPSLALIQTHQNTPLSKNTLPVMKYFIDDFGIVCRRCRARLTQMQYGSWGSGLLRISPRGWRSSHTRPQFPHVLGSRTLSQDSHLQQISQAIHN